MRTAPSADAGVVRFRWVLLGYVVFVVYGATQVYFFYPPEYGGGNWARVIRANVLAYAPWILSVRLIAALLHRWPIERRNWPWRLLGHAVFGVALTSFFLLADSLALVALGYSGGFDLRQMVLANLQSMYPTYWLVFLALFGLESYRRFHRAEVQGAELRASLSEARLAMLSAQLEPHFLFNALNSVAALMHEDVQAAQTMLARLADLLRATLRTDRDRLLPLAQEVELLSLYLEIERMRHEERVRVLVDVPTSLGGLAVPAFVLQPLVENAYRHGFGTRERGGSITVRARTDAGRLLLAVEDDGAGAAVARMAEGVGLGNTRERLAQLYGDRAALRVETGEGAGFRVELEMPAELLTRSDPRRGGVPSAARPSA